MWKFPLLNSLRPLMTSFPLLASLPSVTFRTKTTINEKHSFNFRALLPMRIKHHQKVLIVFKPPSANLKLDPAFLSFYALDIRHDSSACVLRKGRGLVVSVLAFYSDDPRRHLYQLSYSQCPSHAVSLNQFECFISALHR